MRDERQYAVDAIRAFLTGSGGARAWDDFTSGALRDAELNRIRLAARAVDLPLDADGEAMLRALLAQAELAGDDADPARPKPWRMDAGVLAGLLVGLGIWWTCRLSGAGPFQDLHLMLVPAGIGGLIVNLRNSRHKVGAYEPRIVAQNRRGRV